MSGQRKRAVLPSGRPKSSDSTSLTLTQQQFDALVLGLPWQRLPHSQVITRM